jgi:membrane associated rhomboid family serine protease
MSITLVLVIVTCLISYQSFNSREAFLKLQHWPYQEARTKEYYRFLTSGFVHGSWLHLGINMFVLYQFGEIVEERFVLLFGELMGRINFLLLYILTIIFADIPTFIKHRDNPGFASVGASGAVSGIVFAYVIFYPWNLLYLFLILPVPGIVLAIGYLIYSSWASRNSHDNIDHEAHFYGAVFGFLFTIALKPDLFSLFVDRLTNGFPF